MSLCSSHTDIHTFPFLFHTLHTTTQFISQVQLHYRNTGIRGFLSLTSSLMCLSPSPTPPVSSRGSLLTFAIFLYSNSYRGVLSGEIQPGGPRCSGGLLWSDVGSFSQRRLRHGSPSAQNGLRHISVSDLCVCLTLRTGVNAAGARR